MWSKESTSDNFKNAQAVLDLPTESITSTAVANKKYKDCYIVAIGLESGEIHIFSLQIENCSQPWNLLMRMDQR